METDEMNYCILQNAADSLKAGGKLIFTTLSGLYPLSRLRPLPEDSTESLIPDLSNFDLLTLRYRNTIIMADDSGQEKKLKCGRTVLSALGDNLVSQERWLRSVGNIRLQTRRIFPQ